MGPEMVEKIYRSRVKYALEHAYELRANLDILRDEIIQETAVLRVDTSPKTTRFGPEVAWRRGESRARKKLFVCARKRPRNSSKGRNNATMTNVCCSNGWNRDLDVFRVTTKESCAGKRDLSITD